jgi:hypothetical protein
MNFKVNSIIKRGYSTNSSSNRIKMSISLKTVLKDLNLSLVYFYENLHLEDIKKQVSISTRGLSGVYMIINKITKDYYVGSASINRFYARFSNHLIHSRGSKIVRLAVH